MKRALFLLVAGLFVPTVYAQNSLITDGLGSLFVPQEQTSKLYCERSSTTASYTIPAEETLSISGIEGTSEVLEPQECISTESQKGINRPNVRISRYRSYYQGELAFAYGLAVGTGSDIYSRLVFETVHGARISPYAFIGAGLAINHFYKDQVIFEEYWVTQKDNRGTLLPLFVNIKGYLPVSRKVAFYLSGDMGAALDLSNSFDEKTKLYVAAGPGVTFGRQNGGTLGDFSIRFQHIGDGLDAILFRIGVNF